MDKYRDMHYFLFNQTSDLIEKMKEIQQKAEEMYISREDSDLND